MNTDDDRDYTEDPVVTERNALAKECERLAIENTDLRDRLTMAMQFIDSIPGVRSALQSGGRR